MSPPRFPWWLVLVVLLLVALSGGAAVVVVKSRADFLKLIVAEVRRQLEELRPDLSDAQRLQAARILAAQAALESGYGASEAFKRGWNFGNIAKGTGWTGPTIPGGDLEYSKDGKVTKIRQEWRQYATLGDAVSDYFRLLNFPRYRAARDALLRGDVDAFALRLRDDDPATAQLEGGYYTAPLAQYTAGLKAALAAAEAAA